MCIVRLILWHCSDLEAAAKVARPDHLLVRLEWINGLDPCVTADFAMFNFIVYMDGTPRGCVRYRRGQNVILLSKKTWMELLALEVKTPSYVSLTMTHDPGVERRRQRWWRPRQRPPCCGRRFTGCYEARCRRWGMGR